MTNNAEMFIAKLTAPPMREVSMSDTDMTDYLALRKQLRGVHPPARGRTWRKLKLKQSHDIVERFFFRRIPAWEFAENAQQKIALSIALGVLIFLALPFFIGILFDM